jgi:quercetin dioxygenase-like cupin family protein
MEPLMVSIGPGHGDPEHRTFDGDVLLYVMEGDIKLLAEKGETIELAVGDVAYYFGFPGHRIVNASESEPARLLMVTTPPTLQRDDLIDTEHGLLFQSEE